MNVSTNACLWSFRLMSSLRKRISQNRFNELTTRVVAQTVRRYNDDDARIEELEKKIYKCERRIRELEEELKKNQA